MSGAPYVQIAGSQYQDLGQILSGTNMAAGAVISESSYHTNVQWVRNIVCLAQSDQQYTILMYRQDTGLVADWGFTIANNIAATGASTSNWNTSLIYGTNALPSYGLKFAIKNSSASANTFANLRVQLLGQ